LPTPTQLQARLDQTLPVSPPRRAVSSLEPFRERIVNLREKKVECRAILARLPLEAGFTGSYSSSYRFVRALEPRVSETFVRVETPPGEEAQVHFGYAGTLYDPAPRALRKAWVFVMTLSFSRFQYAELVFDQEVATWLRLHRRAFEFFGGVPHRVVLDNLQAAIVGAIASSTTSRIFWCGTTV
jgi:transposase